MGDTYQTIVDVRATESEAAGLARRVLGWLVDHGIVVSEPSDCVLGGEGYAPGTSYFNATRESSSHLLGLRTNGLAIETKRTVFADWENEFELLCDDCSGRFEFCWDAFGDAASEWHGATGPGMLSCPGCGSTRPISAWRFEPPIAFGCLAFTFWNWPQLREDFVESVSAQLRHAVVVIWAKL